MILKHLTLLLLLAGLLTGCGNKKSTSTAGRVDSGSGTPAATSENPDSTVHAADSTPDSVAPVPETQGTAADSVTYQRTTWYTGATDYAFLDQKGERISIRVPNEAFRQPGDVYPKVPDDLLHSPEGDIPGTNEALVGGRYLLIKDSKGEVVEVRRVGDTDGARPALKWDHALVTDINCDGIGDEVLTSQDEKSYYVAVVLGPASAHAKPSIVSFFLKGEAQDAFCGPVQPMTEESMDTDLAEIFGSNPEGYQRSAECKGLRLVSGECDSFHLFWNHKDQRLDWWRL